jgi:hypothetical protein
MVCRLKCSVSHNREGLTSKVYDLKVKVNGKILIQEKVLDCILESLSGEVSVFKNLRHQCNSKGKNRNVYCCGVERWWGLWVGVTWEGKGHE